MTDNPKKPWWHSYVYDPLAQSAAAAFVGFFFGLWWFVTLFGGSSGWQALSAIGCGLGSIFAARWIQKVCTDSKAED